MFFPQEYEEGKKVETERVVFIYESGAQGVSKAVEIKTTHKRLSLGDVRKVLNQSTVRLFNEEGAEYFDDDLQYVKNRAVLYATRGQDFDAGTYFGQYEIGKKLGEGGFGSVFLARHKQTAETVAIKIIKTQNIGSAGDIDAIFVQAQILKSLRHENIVKVHNCLTLKTMEVAIIMQLLQGGQLLQYVEKEGKLDQATALIFFRQIVRGMLYCHQNNLIHRDLKLQNILLVNSQEKKIKIIDFGIAGAISNFKQDDLDIGSLAYMAPQCFQNTKDYKVDGRIDVWAVGVILYCMLHGTLPFRGDNNYETIELIKQGKYKVNPSLKLSPGCIDALAHCLQVNTKKRFTMEELNDHCWVNKNIFGQPQPKHFAKMEPIEESTLGESKGKNSIKIKPHLRSVKKGK